MHPTSPPLAINRPCHRADDGSPPEAGRLRSGVSLTAGSAACVVVPSWALTGSVGVAAAATLATLCAVAAASIMI
jgi:hypothetical protein